MAVEAHDAAAKMRFRLDIGAGPQDRVRYHGVLTDSAFFSQHRPLIDTRSGADDTA
jgi:hypothetical protein